LHRIGVGSRIDILDSQPKRGNALSLLSETAAVFVFRRPILAKILRNFGWQSFDKLFRMGVGVFVSVLITRYLGPDRFGVFSYALAFAGMFTTVAGLGLDRIVIREISKDFSRKNVILGTAFWMKLAGGVATFLLILAAIGTLKSRDTLVIVLTAIFGAALIFNALDVVDFWFQAQIRSKYPVLARNSAFILVSFIKVGLVLASASILSLTLATAAETVFAAAALALAYRWAGNSIRAWKLDRGLARTLLAESWPLIISGFAILIYMRIDQVMLGSLLDDRAVGLYAAAVKFSEIWYFIPMGISSSVFPVMVDYFKDNPAVFFRKYQNVFNIMVILSMGLAVVMTFASGRLAVLVYGPQFRDSGPVLAIHIWAGVFVFLGMAASMWTMINGYQKFALGASLAGAAAKVGLNLLVIPAYGIVGAAATMVVSQAVASYFAYAASAKTRKVFFMMTRAIFMPWRFSREDRTEKP
jgi:PST family polysaccharide transporter